jgi:RimJ/RimL family protein N-acetyltransferase
LRPAELSDAEDRVANGRHNEIEMAYGGTGTDLSPFTIEQATTWAASLAQDPLAWVIEHEGRCVGAAGLHSLDEHDARASYAVGLQIPALLGRGLGTETTLLVLKHAFEVMQLHRVGVRVLASNKRAIRCYTKCGFRLEGRERESARVGDAWQDDLIMGALSTEFGG